MLVCFVVLVTQCSSSDFLLISRQGKNSLLARLRFRTIPFLFIFRERKSETFFKWIKIFFIDTFCHKHILQIEKAYQRESQDGRGGGGEGGGGDILSSSCCSNNSSKKLLLFAICKIFAAFDVLFLWKIIICNLARTLQFEHNWGLTIWHPPPHMYISSPLSSSPSWPQIIDQAGGEGRQLVDRSWAHYTGEITSSAYSKRKQVQIIGIIISISSVSTTK